MTLEETLRQIIREELQAIAELMDSPRQEKTHVGSVALCESLGISRSTLRKMMDDGCPHIRPGSTPRYNLADVRRFLAAKGQGNGGA
jgi:hypothetical protein